MFVIEIETTHGHYTDPYGEYENYTPYGFFDSEDDAHYWGYMNVYPGQFWEVYPMSLYDENMIEHHVLSAPAFTHTKWCD